MPTSRRENRVIETYARSLMESAKAEGRIFSDLADLRVLAEASPEVMAALATMIERGQLDLRAEGGILFLRAEVGQQPPHALELRVAAGDLDEPPLGHARAAGGLKG